MGRLIRGMKRFLLDVIAPLRRGRHAAVPSGRALAAGRVDRLSDRGVRAGGVHLLPPDEREARDRLQRNLGTVYEHAAEGARDDRRVVALPRRSAFGTSATSRSAPTKLGYNRRLRTLTDTLPQLADIWVIDADGQPLVSGTVVPDPAPARPVRPRLFPRRTRTARSRACSSTTSCSRAPPTSAAIRASSRSAANASTRTASLPA